MELEILRARLCPCQCREDIPRGSTEHTISKVFFLYLTRPSLGDEFGVGLQGCERCAKRINKLERQPY